MPDASAASRLASTALVVVSDIEPLGLPFLVRIDELVHQVLIGRIFSHMNGSPSDYTWVVGAWLRLHTEELPE
jgi:hypothetical protein